jgi:hypothetical protein
VGTRGARPLLRAAAFAALGTLLVPGAGIAQQDSTAEPILIRVQVARGPSRVFPAYARDSLVLLPVEALFDLVGTRLEAVQAGRGVVAPRGPGGVRVAILPGEGRLLRGDSARPLAPAEWLVSNDSLYASAEALGWALGLGVQVSWTDLDVALTGTDSLPVVAHGDRDARRAALLRPPLPEPPATPVSAPHAVLDGGLLDWALVTPTIDPSRTSVLQLGAGLQAVGGSLELSTLLQGSGSTFGRTRGTWVRAWQDRSALRQVRLGDVVLGGPDPYAVFGAIVTNAPYLREAAFGTEVLTGRLPRGWEAEVYRFDQLVGYMPPREQPRYALDVPVSYGPNPMALAFYGPSGEVERRSTTVVVPAERLPAGRLEYALGGGGCRDEPWCRAGANADVRYGVSERVTAEAGMQLLSRPGAAMRAYPYALASAGVTRSLGLSVQGAARGFGRARADLDPNPDLHVGLDLTIYDTTAAGLYAGRSPGRTRTVAAVFWRPRVLAGALYFLGSLNRTGRDSTTAEQATLAASLSSGGARATVGVRRTAITTRAVSAVRLSGFDASVQATLNGPWEWSQGTFVRATLRTECPGELPRCTHEVTQAGVSVGRMLFRVLRVDLGASWQRGWRGPGFDLTVLTTLPTLRATSHNAWDPTNHLTGVQVLEGSVRWDRNSHLVDFGNGRNLGRAGVAGVVFLDENGDGRMDDGEPGVPDAQVRVGSQVVRTDSTGRFRVFDLVPFVRTVVATDSLSFPDPTWIATEPRLAITPQPNVFAQVPIAVVRGGEVSGQVVWEAHERAVGGLRVVFRDQARGGETAVTTFSDGTFYAMSVRPGTYWVFVANEQLDQLHARSQPASITVGGGGREVAGVTLHIDFAGQR